MVYATGVVLRDERNVRDPMFDDLAGVDRTNVVMGRVYLAMMAIAYWVGGANVEAVQAVSFVSGLVAVAAILGTDGTLGSTSRRSGPRAGVAPNFVAASTPPPRFSSWRSGQSPSTSS